MKKTGLEIVEMIAKGEAPKKIYLICDEAEWELVDGKHYCYRKAADDIYDLDIMEHLNDEFEIIEEEKVWRPLLGEKYYFIDKFNEVDWAMWNNTLIDNCKYEIGNCFKSKEEAEKEKERKIIKKKLERYALEHNTEKIDWTDTTQEKWIFYYNYYKEKIEFYDLYNTKAINQVYFTSEELCEQAIKEIGEDNIMKLFEE